MQRLRKIVRNSVTGKILFQSKDETDSWYFPTSAKKTLMHGKIDT